MLTTAYGHCKPTCHIQTRQTEAHDLYAPSTGGQAPKHTNVINKVTKGYSDVNSALCGDTSMVHGRFTVV